MDVPEVSQLRTYQLPSLYFPVLEIQSPTKRILDPSADLLDLPTGLVLFFCTFLAMKAEDANNAGRATQDYELRGETQLYAG